MLGGFEAEARVGAADDYGLLGEVMVGKSGLHEELGIEERKEGHVE